MAQEGHFFSKTTALLVKRKRIAYDMCGKGTEYWAIIYQAESQSIEITKRKKARK